MNTCKPSILIVLITIGIVGSSIVPITFDLSYRIQVIQNFMHIPGFIVLTIIVLIFLKNFGLSGWLWFTCSVTVLLLIGIGQEVVQIVIPGRWPSIADIRRNIIGISFGTLLFLLMEKFKPGLIRRIICK